MLLGPPLTSVTPGPPKWPKQLPISANRQYRQRMGPLFLGYTAYTLCFGILGHDFGYFGGGPGKPEGQ